MNARLSLTCLWAACLLAGAGANAQTSNDATVAAVRPLPLPTWLPASAPTTPPRMAPAPLVRLPPWLTWIDSIVP